MRLRVRVRVRIEVDLKISKKCNIQDQILTLIVINIVCILSFSHTRNLIPITLKLSKSGGKLYKS